MLSMQRLRTWTAVDEDDCVMLAKLILKTTKIQHNNSWNIGLTWHSKMSCERITTFITNSSCECLQQKAEQSLQQCGDCSIWTSNVNLLVSCSNEDNNNNYAILKIFLIQVHGVHITAMSTTAVNDVVGIPFKAKQDPSEVFNSVGQITQEV